MTQRTESIAEAVVAAVAKAGADEAMEGASGAQILQRMDSLRLMIAFADIQDRLAVKFEPEQLMQLFLCQSVEDIVAVLEEMGFGAGGGRGGVLGGGTGLVCASPPLRGVFGRGLALFFAGRWLFVFKK